MGYSLVSGQRFHRWSKQGNLLGLHKDVSLYSHRNEKPLKCVKQKSDTLGWMMLTYHSSCIVNYGLEAER